MGRQERIIKEIKTSNSPLANHSLNQYSLKIESQGEERMFGVSKKEEKSERQRALNNFKEFCFLRAMIKKGHGIATPEDLAFIERSREKYPKTYDIISNNGHRKVPTTDHYIAWLKFEKE